MLGFTVVPVMLNVIMLWVIYCECPNHIKHNDTQHHNKNCVLINTILSIMLNVIMLSVIYSDCRNHVQYNDTQHNNKTATLSVM
jgi:hypothetical protein